MLEKPGDVVRYGAAGKRGESGEFWRKSLDIGLFP